MLRVSRKHRVQGLCRPPTSAVNLGVAGEDLLDEGAAGARHAHHKDGGLVLEAPLACQQSLVGACLAPCLGLPED